jgi:predicted Rossmann fold flavoprotein
MVVVIIGGGASGFFSAITCAAQNKNAKVIILEKTDKLLSKVRVSGGGRCNVTNACTSIEEFASNYPRGGDFLLQAFKKFNNKDTVNWFRKRNVSLKTEADGRMFPTTDNSQTIIDCLIEESQKLNIEIHTKFNVQSITKNAELFTITSLVNTTLTAHKVIIASGGYPQLHQYDWLKSLGLNIVKPVPSLFTFNIPSSPLKTLMGVSNLAEVSIKNTTYTYKGPLLITHWGVSGPAILKLSAFAARELEEKKYQFDIRINWVADQGNITESNLKELRENNGKKLVRNVAPFNLPKRLWELFCNQAEVREYENWAELGNKKLQLLFSYIKSFPLTASGKTTFKEEFVTCGGIELNNVNEETLESQKIKGLYFAGESLNIDGITGGFNFQAAWTTGYVAGLSAAVN